jgi:putative restriction endonuclease
MRYWWVNQNQTYRAEVRGSFMWSPKQNANGARNQFYENMRDVSPGDVVFSFCDTRIKALGVVTGGAETGPKPDFGAAGSNLVARRLSSRSTSGAFGGTHAPPN